MLINIHYSQLCLINFFVQLKNLLVCLCILLKLSYLLIEFQVLFHRISFHPRARLLDFAVSLLPGLGAEEEDLLFQALKPALQV